MKAFAQALEAMTAPRHEGTNPRDVLDRAINGRFNPANDKRSPKLTIK